MRKSALFLLFAAASCMSSANGNAPVVLTEADWLSAANTALKLSSKSGAVTFVVDDGLSSEARNALESLRKVVAIADVPDVAVSGSKDYMRIFQFRPQGDRIEFLQGSVYPKVYQAGDCRLSSHLFLSRTADGEWKQDGPTKVVICTRH
ncbi:hypothetical protein [Massilia pseudoviolaceinigra]|uniref:hypothetical protein n=1 Tax=Massilia pseudoviolaceinigra TaxID=3057165 RepID=UPI0027967393|nr:hypothetical protein [Massilia sp. CCM 9206]MDQ1924651.1 hypothetical protein [Massilia sp. CCM 9206]